MWWGWVTTGGERDPEGDRAGMDSHTQPSMNWRPSAFGRAESYPSMWSSRSAFLNSDPVLDFHEILTLMLPRFKIISFHHFGLVRINPFKTFYKPQQQQPSQKSREWSRRPVSKQMWQLRIRVSDAFLGQTYLAGWWTCSGKTDDHLGKTNILKIMPEPLGPNLHEQTTQCP